jgi:phosphatidylserine/phosphatidylglycerophosphate/cardiolipin synthase-like enzyme
MKRSGLVLIISVILVGCFVSTVFAESVEAVTPINDRDYGPAMIKLIRNAQTRIKLMQYQARFYDEYPDTLSNKFLEEIVKAIERGVHVMVIVDVSSWNEEGSEYNTQFAAKLAEKGAEVYLDDPEIVSHQKVTLIDDVITVLGSMNWSFYALDRNNEASVIVWSQKVNADYTKYFNQRLADSRRYIPKKPVPNLELARKKGFNLTTVDEVKPVNNRDYYPELHKAISNATERIWVSQVQALYYMSRPPYAPKDHDNPEGAASLTNLIIKDLAEASKRGVDVRVALDIQAERANVNIDGANRLIPHGVRVFFDSPEVTSHAKMLIIDDDLTILGSTNWSLNAVEIGNEANVFIKSKELNAQYADYIAAIMKGGTEVVATSEFKEPDENEDED